MIPDIVNGGLLEGVGPGLGFVVFYLNDPGPLKVIILFRKELLARAARLGPAASRIPRSSPRP